MDNAITEPSHLIDVISSTLPFFFIAGMVVPLLQRLKLSPVLGYLICGIAIGPYGLALLSNAYPWVSYITISDANTVHILGELGIITLMFMIGLELSMDRLKQLRHYIFGLGTAQILLTAFAVFTVAKLFDNSAQASVLLGVSFALSSTAIVMNLLDESKLTSQPVGTLCFSILLMQDLAVVPILLLASSFSGDHSTHIIIRLGASLFFGMLTVVLIYFLGEKVINPLFKSVSFSTTPEWLAAFVVFIVLTCSIFTYMAGMSLALGALVIGLLIAETEFKHEVEVIVRPIKGLLLGIFFLSIGMMINMKDVFNFPILLLLSVIGIFLLKSTILSFLCVIFKVPSRLAVQTSIYLAQPGEFALMILGVALSTKLMPEHDVQFFLLVTVLAMILTPLMFKISPLLERYSQGVFGKQNADDSLSHSISKHSVVIAGFGRVGQLIAKVLQAQKISYIAFDSCAARVKKLKNDGFHVIYGDAGKKALWQLLVSDQIEAAVIAIDDHKATKNILKSLRTQFPLLPVIVRSKDMSDSNMLYDEGADYVVAETLESSLRIAELLMKQIIEHPEDAQESIRKIRRECRYML